MANRVDIRCVGNGPIVMVDDEMKDRFIARRCFNKSKLQPKFEFLEFSDGASFWAYLSEEVGSGSKPMPSLVLIDINMPGMSGFDLLQIIRGSPSFSQMPVLAMFSSSQNPSDIKKAESMGANGYQVKPFALEEYVAFFDSLAG